MEAVRTYTSKYDIGDVVLVGAGASRCFSGIGKVVDIRFNEDVVDWVYKVKYTLLREPDPDLPIAVELSEPDIMPVSKELIKKLFQ